MKIDFVSDINKDNYYVLDYDRVDQSMVKFLWWSFGLFVPYVLAIYFLAPAEYYPNPFTWRVVNLTEVFWVIVLGFLTTLVMTLLRGRLKSHYLYRFLIANALMMYSYLTIFISGGSIEWHFHFFIMFGVLVLYADWRLGWWAILAVALHHGILNFVAPHWVYFYGRNDIAFIVHALLVLAMAIVTTKLCENYRQLAEASRMLGKEFNEKIERIR